MSPNRESNLSFRQLRRYYQQQYLPVRKKGRWKNKPNQWCDFIKMILYRRASPEEREGVWETHGGVSETVIAEVWSSAKKHLRVLSGRGKGSSEILFSIAVLNIIPTCVSELSRQSHAAWPHTLTHRLSASTCALTLSHMSTPTHIYSFALSFTLTPPFNYTSPPMPAERYKSYRN